MKCIFSVFVFFMNIVPEVFLIPDEEPFYRENESGTLLRPWLYWISDRNSTSKSLIFYVKIGKKYYGYCRYRKFANFEINGKQSIRCVAYGQSKTIFQPICKARGRIKFLLDPSLLDTYPYTADVKNINNWEIMESASEVPHVCGCNTGYKTTWR